MTKDISALISRIQVAYDNAVKKYAPSWECYWKRVGIYTINISVGHLYIAIAFDCKATKNKLTAKGLIREAKILNDVLCKLEDQFNLHGTERNYWDYDNILANGRYSDIIYVRWMSLLRVFIPNDILNEMKEIAEKRRSEDNALAKKILVDLGVSNTVNPIF